MKIKRHSWILTVACYGGLRFERGEKTNVCSLFWYVIWGLLRAPAIALAAAFAVCCVIFIFIGFPLFELGFWAAYGLRPDTPTLWVLGIIGACWAFVLYQVFAALSGKRVIEDSLGSVADVISSRWRDYKAKTCTIVEIE